MRLQTGVLRTLWGLNVLLAAAVFLGVFVAVGLIPPAGAAGPSPPGPVDVIDGAGRAPLNSFDSIWRYPPAKSPQPPLAPAEPPLDSVVTIRGASFGRPELTEVTLEPRSKNGARQITVLLGETFTCGGVTAALKRVFTDPVTRKTTAVFRTAGGTDVTLTLP